MFLILVRNILCPQQMFPSLRNMETMLPRFQYFPGLLVYLEHAQNSLLVRQNGGKYSTPLSTQSLQEVQNVTRRVRHERSWKDEEIETLISLYEERVCLWDFGREEYINRDGKDLAYEQRDEELKKYNISREEYKSKSSAAIFVARANWSSLHCARDVAQEMFPSLRSMETQHSFCVPRVCAPKKHHEQQCVRNNVSSFASTLRSFPS